MEFFLQIVGWLGTGLIIFAYFLVSTGRTKGTSATYQLMNLFGVSFLGIDMAVHHVWAGLTLQIVSGAIAIFSLIHHREK